MSITAEDVRAAVRPIPATPAAAPLPDTEIQRLLKVLNQHSSDRASAPPGRPSVTRPRGSARTHNFDAALAQLGAEGHQVQHGAAEPVQAGDLEGVAGAEQLEGPAREDEAERLDRNTHELLVPAGASLGVHPPTEARNTTDRSDALQATPRTSAGSTHDVLGR